MGNTMSCLERWGKRQPDGPLLNLTPGKAKTNYLLNSLSKPIKDSAMSQSPDGRPHISHDNSSSMNAALAVVNDKQRGSRRRPTYSATKKKSDTEISSFADEDSEYTQSEEELTAKDVRALKISEYRRSLTKIVKLKSTLGSMTVKATISKDGVNLEWYKGKSHDGETAGKKKPVGFFPIDKIAVMKSKSDNPKTLEVSLRKGSGFETYYFLFKSREEREIWQKNLESFRKFIALK